jgi:hypothetical protein
MHFRGNFLKISKISLQRCKTVPKFRNFIGIQKFLHLCTKNIEICEFLRNYICIFANVRSPQPFSDEATIYCDISTFKNTVVLANPILNTLTHTKATVYPDIAMYEFSQIFEVFYFVYFQWLPRLPPRASANV